MFYNKLNDSRSAFYQTKRLQVLLSGKNLVQVHLDSSYFVTQVAQWRLPMDWWSIHQQEALDFLSKTWAWRILPFADALVEPLIQIWRYDQFFYWVRDRSLRKTAVLSEKLNIWEGMCWHRSKGGLYESDQQVHLRVQLRIWKDWTCHRKYQ